MATDRFEVNSGIVQHGTWVQRPSEGRLSVALANSESEIRESQRLRYKVFGEEQGAELHGSEAGLDEDKFDPYCRHVLVVMSGSRSNQAYSGAPSVPGRRSSRSHSVILPMLN